jgi:pyruvate/2-oxoglutarate dehydrogenase complex dihydrolipoamide dehydrogenase (E3) component
MHSPVVVLGGGPGGYAAAFLAADEGLEVVLVEAETKLGGTCLLRGCIPSKALLHVAKVLGEAQAMHEEWGVDFGTPKIDIDKVRARKEKVIETLTGGLGQLAKRRNVKVIRARGKFENSTTLILEGSDPSIPEGGRLTFDHCVVATGSVPAMPPAFNIGSSRVMDSTGALALVDIPEKLLVIGGGYIGLEMGTVYAHLGSKVSVVEWTDGLLPGADRDLVKPLHNRLKKLLDNRIFLNTKVGSLAEVDQQIEVTFEGPGKFGHERFDRVLVSVGRRPVTQGLGLETTSVKSIKKASLSAIGNSAPQTLISSRLAMWRGIRCLLIKQAMKRRLRSKLFWASLLCLIKLQFRQWSSPIPKSRGLVSPMIKQNVKVARLTSKFILGPPAAVRKRSVSRMGSRNGSWILTRIAFSVAES